MSPNLKIINLASNRISQLQKFFIDNLTLPDIHNDKGIEFAWGKREYFNRILNHDGVYAQLVIDKNDIIVAACISYLTNLTIPSVCIDILGVATEFRKQNIGTELINNVDKWARLHRINILDVSSFVLYQAREFYEKLGFKIYNTTNTSATLIANDSIYHFIKHLKYGTNQVHSEDSRI